MPKYDYKAIDRNGKETTGVIDASNEMEANQKLSGKGLQPTAVTPAKSSASTPAGGGKQTPGQKPVKGKVLNSEQLTVFTRQLATLLQAGLPLLRSLEVLIRQERNPKFKMVLTQMADNVRSGNTLSNGMAMYPKIFDHLYTHMVRAGEAGGVLDVVLARLALFMEKSVKIRKKVKAAMIYPVIVIFVAVAIVTLLMVYVVPKFQDIFESMLKGQALPPLTQSLINFSESVQNQWWAWIIGIVVIYILYKLIRKSKGGARFFDKFYLKVPKVGSLLSKVAIARFTRTFGTLLSSGVPLLEALNITREVVGNVHISEALGTVHDRVRDGESIAAPMERTKAFPTMVTSMIDVGEETGELPNMLTRIADNYDEDVDNAVAGITSIIEPIMIVFLAVVVGFIVIALFMPIVSIIQNLSAT